MNINITIQAPELIEAMNRLAKALEAGQVKPAQVEQVIEKLETEAKPKKPKADKPAPAPAPATEVVADVVETPAEKVTETDVTVTLEDIRVKLGNLSQAGKQAEVKKLIASFGATKLSEIESAKYAELMAKAEAI